MERISKRVREEAIEALLVCADDRIASGVDYGITTGQCVDGGTSSHVYDVTNAAFGSVSHLIGFGSTVCSLGFGFPMRVMYLEAAALLRDGWRPGDPVHLIAKEGK